MKTKTLITLLALVLTSGIYGQKKGTTGYADVNGLHMYYEVHGEGEPLIILHGAYMSIEGPMRQLAELFPDRKVILTELQGHGRTGDINRDITYEAMADDVSALIKFLKLDSVDVLGYSMGGGTALQLAIRHPQQVKKITVISASYNYAGLQDSFKPLVPMMTAEMFAETPIKPEYDSLAPDPSKFPVLVEKLKKLDLTEFDWKTDYVKITKPMFLMFADNDVITMQHISDMYTGLGGGVMGDLEPMPDVQLAVIPKTTHVTIMFNVDLFAPMLKAFFERR